MPESTQARRYLVTGRVQGVGFRWYTCAAGRELGLHGWVRNLADGRVEALVAGNEGQLARFAQRLRRGPAGSVVTGVEESTPPAAPDGWAATSSNVD